MSRSRRRKREQLTVELRIAELHVQVRGETITMRAEQLRVQLRRELRGEQQLALELATARAPTSVSPSSVPESSALVRRRFQRVDPCRECQRRGYHLKRCSNHPSRREEVAN